MFRGLKRIIKIIKVRLKDSTVRFESNANFSANSVFEGQNWMRSGAWLNGYLGYGSYIGYDCMIEGKIGRYCSIGHNVTVLTGNHPASKFVSTSPCFFSLAKQNGMTYVSKQKFNEKLYADEINKYGIVVGNDVWIGYGATIIGGVTIGDGAIIGANAYVNEDVEPYSIVVGTPARKVKYRFTDEQIKYLLELKWWDKDEEWIRSHADYFEDIEKLMEVSQLQNGN